MKSVAFPLASKTEWCEPLANFDSSLFTESPYLMLDQAGKDSSGVETREKRGKCFAIKRGEKAFREILNISETQKDRKFSTLANSPQPQQYSHILLD